MYNLKNKTKKTHTQTWILLHCEEVFQLWAFIIVVIFVFIFQVVSQDLAEKSSEIHSIYNSYVCKK